MIKYVKICFTYLFIKFWKNNFNTCSRIKIKVPNPFSWNDATYWTRLWFYEFQKLGQNFGPDPSSKKLKSTFGNCVSKSCRNIEFTELGLQCNFSAWVWFCFKVRYSGWHPLSRDIPTRSLKSLNLAAKIFLLLSCLKFYLD